MAICSTKRPCILPPFSKSLQTSCLIGSLHTHKNQKMRQNHVLADSSLHLSVLTQCLRPMKYYRSDVNLKEANRMRKSVVAKEAWHSSSKGSLELRGTRRCYHLFSNRNSTYFVSIKSLQTFSVLSSQSQVFQRSVHYMLELEDALSIILKIPYI